MEFVGEQLVAVDSQDKAACQIAYELSVDGGPILPLPLDEPLLLNHLGASRVVRGLARISLRPSDQACHHLSPLAASQMLLELLGAEEVARISLETPDYSYCGLSQEAASQLIDRLWGTIENPEAITGEQN